jgi:anti-sigma factor RsiW
VTLDCSQLAEMVLDFVNGELPDDRLEVFEAHLKACPPCFIHVQTYRVTITMTRSLPCRSIPSDVEQRLRDAVMREFQQ